MGGLGRRCDSSGSDGDSSDPSYVKGCCLDGERDYVCRKTVGVDMSDDAVLELRHSM
jgi:hypothetical protein